MFLSSSEKGLNGDSNPDLRDREQVVVWVDYMPVDVEIDGNRRIFHVFEMWFGMNEFDHHVLAPLTQHEKDL